MKWNKARFVFPDKAGEYLAYAADCGEFGMQICQFDDELGWGYYGGDVDHLITHWMPLPTPPKEERDAKG